MGLFEQLEKAAPLTTLLFGVGGIVYVANKHVDDKVRTTRASFLLSLCKYIALLTWFAL